MGMTVYVYRNDEIMQGAATVVLAKNVESF
jgi:hypothetical protein